MRTPNLWMRSGFVEPMTAAMIALFALGMVSFATTSRALDEAVRTDAATTAIAVPAVSEPALVPTVPTPVAEPTVPTAPAPVNTPVNTSVNAPAPIPAEEPSDQPPPDPRECRDVQRQIKDQIREITRLEKLMKKAKLVADLDLLGTTRAKANQFAAGIAKACTRDALQEFYDEQLWEDVNKVRCKAELPQQFAQLDREFKRLERTATAKKLAIAGLDAEKYRAHTTEAKQAIADARAAVTNGNCEDANEAMQTIYEGKHPGEVNGVIQRLYELGNQLQRVKDEAVRSEFQEVLQPVIDAANEGDFREANQALNDVFNELQQLLARVIRSRQYRGYESRLEKLEEMIGAKLEGERAPAAVPAR